MALVPYFPPVAQRTTPVPREVLPVKQVVDLLMKAAMQAVDKESSGTQEIKEVVLHPIRVKEHNLFAGDASPPVKSSPLKGVRDLQLRAHVVNQVLIRDFYSGDRGEHLVKWVKSLYVVADWLWESYRDGAAPELTPVESMSSRRSVPYTPSPINFDAATPAGRDGMYKKHIEEDPYQPFEQYVVKSVHQHFQESTADPIVSIRVKRHPNTIPDTEKAMHNFMIMLELEAEHGVLDPDNTEQNPLHPALLAGVWALSSLHDNFSQDPNALDDPSFWLLQLLNHSLSRNHCYQKMPPGKRAHPHLALPTAAALAIFQARNRPAIRSSIELKYQRMFRALHLMVVQKVCLVLRTRFKRLHKLEPTKENKVDPTAFNKAAGFHKAHLNEAEESWRKGTSSEPQEILLLQQQQRLLTFSEEHDQEELDNASLPEVGKLAGEAERRKVAMAFLQRSDLPAPVCTTAAALAGDARVVSAKQALYSRVNDIDQSMALHKIYTDCVTNHYEEERLRYASEQDALLERMREAWSEGNEAEVESRSGQFAECGKCAVHLSASTGRSGFLRSVATGQISLNMFAHHSSFCGANEAIYGCRVPDEWCQEGGGKPKLGNAAVNIQQVVEKMFPCNGGGLISAAVYGPDGAWAAERAVLLKLLEELQSVLRGLQSADTAKQVVHLPMIMVCAKKWNNSGGVLAIGESELKQVCEYIASKERARQEMDACVVAMQDQMHHVVEAAFRFVLLRSLPGRACAAVEERRTLPIRSSDDRVAAVARAHLYMMLAIAQRRNMRTTTDEPIFSVDVHGLHLANTHLWACNDWVGFCMMVDVALSAEGGYMGREQASVSLLTLPAFMLSDDGIVEVPLHSQDAGQIIDQMVVRTEGRYGTAPATSFLYLHPFNCTRCVQLLRLNWNAYRYLRPTAKTEDISRFSRMHPWKGQPVHIASEDRELATTLYIKEYERFVQRGSQVVAESTALPPITYNDPDDDELSEPTPSKVPRRL
jgi:hypothetical protein